MIGVVLHRVKIERLSTGVRGIDEMIQGGIPRGFFVAVVGEPGTGKTIFCIHFIAQGIREGDKNIYVTTEESRESIIKQAAQFGFDFERAIEENRLIIIDALMGGRDDPWSLRDLTPEALVEKVIEAKKSLGRGRARLVVDSMSAFWLDKPAMARKYSYYVKRVLYRWDFTALLVAQYAVTTSLGFGFGVEHVADGIIRFRKAVVGGVLRRYVIIEKMRQTQHDLRMHEIEIVDGVGMRVKQPTPYRKEDYALPRSVVERILEAEARRRKEILGSEESETIL
ncbi:KaiC domain-containing protein [Pyrolobus fumarii]